jgi:hypothetical protein
MQPASNITEAAITDAFIGLLLVASAGDLLMAARN